jgi:hypothetical protein
LTKLSYFIISIFVFQHPIRFYPVSFHLVFLLAIPFNTGKIGRTRADDIVDIGDVVPERTIGICAGGVKRFLIRPTHLAVLLQLVAGWFCVSVSACREQVDHYMVATVGVEQNDSYSG